MSATSLWQRIALNWKSGLTVSLVSVPLAVSLAVASQATPEAGILTAVWAGLVASIFGGSKYNVIGPTGALSGLLASQALLKGADCLPMLAVLAGIFVLCAYFLQLEKFLFFIPSSVLHGFIVGVAIIIILTQLNAALGLTVSIKHEHFIDNVVESFRHIGQSSGTTFLFFGVVLSILLLLARYAPRVPGAFIVTPVAILVGYAAKMHYISLSLLTLGDQFTTIKPVLFQLMPFRFSLSFILPSFAIAVIAILETMMSAKVADVVTKTKHDKNKEIFGLGLANIVSGLMGGIPATAALARTSLNIKSGCTDKISATISSIGIAVVALLFLSYFRFIPLAAIAAILVFVSVRMVEAEHLKRMFCLDKRSFVIMLLVAAVTVYEDPIIGILLGVAIAMIVLMEKLSQGHYELLASEKILSTTKEISGIHWQLETLIYAIKGPLAYVNAQSHVIYFEHYLDRYRYVILKLKDLSFIDLDGSEALTEIIQMIEDRGKIVLVTGINPLVDTMLQENKMIAHLKKSGRVFITAAQALEYLDTVVVQKGHVTQ